MEEDLQKKKGLWKRLVTSLDWALKRMSEEEVSEEQEKDKKIRYKRRGTENVSIHENKIVYLESQ